VRLLARAAPPGAVAALLDFLPFADDSYVEDATIEALLTLTPADGKTDAALTAALRDPAPVKRAAVAHVLGRRGDQDQTASVRQLLSDKDPKVRWRAALALLSVHDRAAPPALIDLTADAPPEFAWQAEDVLQKLAGDAAPEPVAGDDDDARKTRRDRWKAWWKDHGADLDLAKFDEADRLLGYTLIVEYSSNRVWEAAADGSVRWELRGLSGPMDAQVLPGGRVLVAESGTLSERDFKGNVKWEKKLDFAATGCQRLANGNTFVPSYGAVTEFAPDGSVVYSFKLETGSNAIRKMRNGHIAYALDGEIVEADTTGKKVQSIPLPNHTMYVGLQDLPGDRFVVANSASGRVLEVDAAGKVLWEGKVEDACGVERLPNGDTLVATNRKVVELNKDGKAVWEKPTEGYARRIHRR
jgi:hypothetical protein